MAFEAQSVLSLLQLLVDLLCYRTLLIAVLQM